MSFLTSSGSTKAGELSDDTMWCERDCKYEYIFFKRFAEDGSSLANLALSIMNYRGHGREVDINAGNRFLFKAARAEEPAAMYQLGYFLLYGLYMEQDFERALIWLKRARANKIGNAAELVAMLENTMTDQTSDKSKMIMEVLTQPTEPAEKLHGHGSANDGVERISVVQSFSWDHTLTIAKQQTCRIQSNCGIRWGYMLFPRIKAINEQALIEVLNR
jgi:TPR repeat protein